MSGMGSNLPFATNRYTGQVIKQLGLSPSDMYTNKRKDIQAYQQAFGNSLSDPLYQSTAAKLGITDYSSVDDYARVLDYMSNNQQQAPATAPTTNNPQPAQTYNPTTATADNFNPNGLQIRTPESDPMITQLQQMLINTVRPPDTNQFNSQLTDIGASVQGLPGQLASQTGLGQGVSLDSFSKVSQSQTDSSLGQSLIPNINASNGLEQKLGDGFNGNASNQTLGNGLRETSTSNSTPNVQQGYNQQLQGLQDQFKWLTDMQNQAGWRAKAAMQIGSQSADSVQSASMSGPSGTDKLNRNQSGNYLNNLTIKEPNRNAAAGATPTASPPILVPSQPILVPTLPNPQPNPLTINQDPEMYKKLLMAGGKGNAG